jgi:pimeloyl-ACP methyl ester carboxylesterase
MLASWLRWRFAAELVICGLLAWLLARAGWGAAAAVSVAALAFLLLQAVVVAFTFGLAARHSVASPVGAPSLPVRFLREYLSYLALFSVIQPFERFWMGSDRIGPPQSGEIPVLLVHGYLCNRGVWWWLRGRLRKTGFAVATVNLEPPHGGIDALADQLQHRITDLRAETGTPRVILICHSMGGLVARALLARHGSEHIALLLTLATPHHGTWLARYGPGRNAREMRPASDWIAALPPIAKDTPVVSAWSPVDNFILPQDASRLAGAREVTLPPLTHLAIAFSPAIFAVLQHELASACAHQK